MLRSEKVEFVGKLADKLKQSKSVVLADFRGLNVAEMNALRDRLFDKQVELRVVKNRLGKRALADAGCEALDEFLEGNTAWAFGVEDAVEPAKILSEFAKGNEKLVIKGGLLEARRIDKATVAELASLPSRAELLSKMAGGLKQPAVKMATAMEASVVKVARAFQALADKLEGQGGAAS